MSLELEILNTNSTPVFLLLNAIDHY